MKAIVLALLVSAAVPALGSSCATIHFAKCYGVDTLSGATLYEWEVVDCKTFRLKKYSTDYTCSKPGALSSTEDSPIDGAWKEANHTTAYASDESEYGSYFFKDRYFWNADKTRLIYEAAQSKDVMAMDFLDSSHKFHSEQEESIVKRSYAKEADEIVERSQFSKRWKNRWTRGEWLEKSHSEITDYPAN